MRNMQHNSASDSNIRGSLKKSASADSIPITSEQEDSESDAPASRKDPVEIGEVDVN